MFELSLSSLLMNIVLDALILVPAWKIMARASLNPLFSLLIIIPYVGFLIVAVIIAFAPWGIPKQLAGDSDGN